MATAADKPVKLPLLSKKHLGAPKVSWWLPIALLAATCLSTFFAGSMSWQPHETLGAAAAVVGKQLGMIEPTPLLCCVAKSLLPGPMS